MQEGNDILTPDEVAKLMPSSVPKSWVYAHWEELGGVKIGKRKLILREVLYGNLQKREMVVRKDNEGRNDMDPRQSGHGSKKMEKEKGGQTGRSGTNSESRAYKNYSNEFGLVDAVQRISKRRKSQLLRP